MTDLEQETEVPERTQASAVRSCKRVYKSIYYVHLLSYVIPKCRLNSIHIRKKKKLMWGNRPMTKQCIFPVRRTYEGTYFFKPKGVL